MNHDPNDDPFGDQAAAAQRAIVNRRWQRVVRGGCVSLLLLAVGFGLLVAFTGLGPIGCATGRDYAFNALQIVFVALFWVNTALAYLHDGSQPDARRRRIIVLVCLGLFLLSSFTGAPCLAQVFG